MKASSLGFLNEEELKEFDGLLAADTPIWEPLKGPQTMAYESEATIIGYGGAAGGGKTDLACGMSLTKHQRVGIFRESGTELTAIVDRLVELVGSRDGYNGSEKIWRIPRESDGKALQIELGAYPNLGDEKKHQGRPHDLLVYDEAANHKEIQVRFTMGWLRTTDPNQPVKVLMTFNPPTTVEGRWIIDYFAPWIGKKHPNPAEPGEIRWFAAMDGKDVEVESGDEFEHEGELIRPISRTFIPSRISDNPHLMGTNYMSTLQALPEPLRSQMLHGDFGAGMQDDIWQVIPTAWVEAAQARWKPRDKKPIMDSMGVDVARGGGDKTVISRRHDNWYDEQLRYAGKETPDGPSVAGLVIAATRDQAPQHVDVIGVGSSPYDFLIQSNQQALGVNVSEKSMATDQSGRLTFFNLRSELAWKFREDLDPANNKAIELPDDPSILADLTAFTWKLSGSVIKVCSREEIVDKIGRSPDDASALFLARMDTPKEKYVSELVRAHSQGGGSSGHDPYNAI